MPALTRPITAVTVSIIAQILCAPAQSTKRLQPCTVKKIHGAKSQSAVSDDLLQQIPGERHGKSITNGIDAAYRMAGPRKSPDARCNLSFTTRKQIVHRAGALPISAVFRLRYLHDAMRVGPRRWG